MWPFDWLRRRQRRLQRAHREARAIHRKLGDGAYEFARSQVITALQNDDREAQKRWGAIRAELRRLTGRGDLRGNESRYN